MKNRFLTTLLIFFSSTYLYAETLLIEAKDITLDKNKKITIFKNNVNLKTKDATIFSQFAEYDKNTEEIILKENVIITDELNNVIKTNYAEYNNKKNTLKTVGSTTLISSTGYTLNGENINFDNKNKKINSNKNSILKDLSNNEIYLANFEYLQEENIFKSFGFVKIIDKLKNNYEFSQIYIDTKKKEILGTDIKAFLNHEDFKINDKNNPRVFANTMRASENSSSFDKSIFTLCEFKEGEKCPPWTLQAKKMTHDNKKKTIYYDNAVIKIYNIPVFYTPFLSHPDPTVKRRSVLLPPTFSSSKNLGSGI